MATVGKRSSSLEYMMSRNISTAVNGASSSALHNRSLDSTISLLNFDLYVARVKKEFLSMSTHYLLQVFLRLFGETPECRRGHFFSFTETSSEYSIISDKHLLEVLIPKVKESAVEVTECKWRPLVVEVGALGSVTGISNIAATVISPLADCGVSVFCLSTNLEDYVMVREGDLEKALACLSQRFKVVCDADNEKDVSLIRNMVQQQSSVNSPTRERATSHGCQPPEGMSRPIIHPYNCSESHYVLCGVNPGYLRTIGTAVLDLMLFSDKSSSQEGFLSFSVVEEDISLVMGSDNIYKFPEDSLYINKEVWRLITIGEGPLGFDECGIVAQVASPLAKSNISSYYICTFSMDHTLVPEGSVKQALQLLNERYVSKLINKLYRNGTDLNGHSQTLMEQPNTALEQKPLDSC